ncbi:hypothetical protein JOM56_013043 [Amanita muscaria]
MASKHHRSLTSYHHLPLSDMPSNPVVRASSASYGRFSDLSVDSLEDITVPPTPVITTVSISQQNVVNQMSPIDYTKACIDAVFQKKHSGFHRAQSLYAAFIELASELETTSHFNNVMTRIAENLATLGCKTEPCTLHCDKSHFELEPCTLEHVTPCTLTHAEPCSLPHFFVTPEPCPLQHAEPCHLPHAEPCHLPHNEPCKILHIDPCALSHAEPCTLSHAEPCILPHNDICALNHFPVEPVTVAVTIPCPLAHNDLCTKEHVNSQPSSPSLAPRQLKRKRFKKKQKANTTDNISDNNDMDYFNDFGSEPEIDLDGFFANPNYDLSVALEEFKNCGGSAEELHRFRLLYEELHSVGGACHIPYRLDDPPNTPSVSLPTRSRDHNMETHPLPVTQTHPLPVIVTQTHTSSLPTSDPLPPASTSALPIGALAPTRPSYLPHVPKVSLPRAQTEPLPQNSSTTMIPPRAQTAPPDVSRNTLTAQRCTNKDASPSSFVKFMDVPVTMTREHIHDCLQNNRKWSTVNISNVEIFAIKNKDSNVQKEYSRRVYLSATRSLEDADHGISLRDPTSAPPFNIAPTTSDNNVKTTTANIGSTTSRQQHRQHFCQHGQ